jgi:hypothetical protein
MDSKVILRSTEEVPKIKKWLWRLTTHAIACMITAIAVLFYVYIPLVDTGCFENPRVISKNNRGDEVELNEQICDGFGHSITVFINLIPSRTGRKETVLSYEQGNADPKVSWDGDGVLIIDIPEGALIHRKIEDSHGLNIRYRGQPKLDHS